MVWAAVVVQRGGVCMTGVFNRPIQSTHPGAVHEEKLSFSFTGSSPWFVWAGKGECDMRADGQIYSGPFLPPPKCPSES